MRQRFVIWCCGWVFASSVFAQRANEASHANPKQSDPVLELARLRAEGAAQYESGIGLKKALAAFEAAARLQPQSAIELFNLGATHRKLGNVDQAIESLSEAHRRDPNLTHAAYTLGLVQRGRGDTPGAISAFESALETAPHDASIHYQLGRLYREQHREAAALQAYVDALQLDPQHPGTMYQMYLYYQEHGEKDRAKQMFEEFSRVKRALSRARKELNDDETVLARPIVVPTAPALPTVRKEPLRWTLADVVKGQQAMSLAVRDMDGDGLEDILIGARDGAVSVYRNEGKLRFASKTRLDGNAVGAIAAEILVRGEMPRVFLGTLHGLFVSSADMQLSKVSSTDASEGVSFADLDHDGDVDVIVGAFKEVLMNDGAGVFRAEKYVALASRHSGAPVAADMLDRNGIDFVLQDAKGARVLLADQLGGRHLEQKFPPLTAIKHADSMVAADMDNDGQIDLVSSASQGVQIDYHEHGYRFTASALNRIATAHGGTISVGDFDNDGWKDLIALDASGLRWWRNLGGRKFGAQNSVKVANGAPHAPPIVSDLDGDGRPDLIVLTAAGDVQVLKNESQNIGQSLRVVLQGLRSAPSGLHATIEVRRGNLYQKYVAGGGTLTLPLGSADYAEILRIVWPNGFIESKLKVDAGKPARFIESERVSGSCPSVFAWDGRQFRFITDAFISGPMGVPLGPKSYFPVDHDEYLKIPGESLRADGGKLRVAITEELREAVFLDRVNLLAVDHPADTELYPNEFLFPGVFPEYKLHLTAGAQPLSAAVDQTDRDVSDLVSTVDRRYPAAFRRLQYEGLAEENGVELQLPKGAALAPSLRLFLTGWFHYFESTSIVAASQRRGLKIEFPHVDVLEHGKWRVVMVFGIPSGKDKTVVVDLSHRLPPNAQRIRVRSNLALYWDRIAIDMQAPPRESAVRRVDLQAASLRFRGFSGFEPVQAHERPQPERFVYSALRTSAPWNPLHGKYTRYGMVRPLLTRVDSQMTVFGSGDELLLEFDATALPPPRAGWRRDYLLHLDGFVKDGDKYTAHAGQLEPMPFAGMTRYPYSAGDPGRAVLDSLEYRAYLERYQTRAPLRFTGPRITQLARYKESYDARH